MEIINIEKETFLLLVENYNNLKDQMESLLNAMEDKRLDEWLDNQAVCQILNISPRTLQTYRDTRKISFCQINHKILYKPSDIEKFIEHNTYIQCK